MIKFIGKLIKFIFKIFIGFIIFTYIFSLKSNMSFEATLSHFKTVATNILGTANQGNIATNTDVDNIPVATSTNNHYYYLQLDENAKLIYATLEKNISNLKKENYTIDFSTTFNDLLHESLGQYKLNKSFQSALDAFFYDHPEIFYIDLTKISLIMNCISLGPSKTYTVQIKPNDNKNYLYSHFNSEYQVDIAVSKVENIKNKITAELEGKSVYNKILTVHDMLVNSIEYKDGFANIRNIYGALVEKQVVCEGYAKAFKYIMDEIDVECILVSGDASDSSGSSEPHMWNYVKLNNNWYGVDVTWDDPIIIGGNSNNSLRHAYFLKGTNAFINSHVSTGRLSDTGMLFRLPTLSDTNYKY